MSSARRVAIAIAIAALTGCSYGATDTPDTGRRLLLAEQGHFFRGGHYVK